MGVDGIGSGGGRPIGGVGRADRDTEIEGAPQAGAAGVQGQSADAKVDRATSALALHRLERGEIGLGQYLDARVDDAVRHLEGKLSSSQVQVIRQALRQELSSDPVLVELVRRTTGQVPSE